ncbi:S8 family serine peptidase [Streptomyces sp. HUAS MG91]|uniref:S8 family serine peptidase n=1 Tax=Streptomyces tabacisoli TaxID=3156398 RepID=A0AAU8J259_9ACTN
MPESSRGRSRRRLVVAAAASAVVTMLSGLPAAGATPSATGPDSPAAAVPAALKKQSSSSVTLVTGDTVTVTTRADGKRSVDVAAAPGASKTFQTVTTPDGDLFVFPSDAVAPLAAKSLDRTLFNVTRLLADGQADGKAARVPVVVEYADKASRSTLTRRADHLPSGRPGAVLDRLDMAAVKVDKKGAGDFWRSVGPQLGTAGKGSAAKSSAATGPVAKLWYDGVAKVSLDKSVPQIGAPAAWAAGLDGKGTEVAVLDTGADTTHPDLKGRIGATKSFVPGVDSVKDGHGHGTHVASTVAGTGAASGGRLKGVAPGARLMIGKVLDDGGSGPTSQVIAGMEWAVEQGADIVSMSLGSPATAGGDLSQQAVDRLSADSDTLFVIAAGNEGPGRSTLGSPGIAESALTVGAVDKSDRIAEFSSRGPRLGDNGIKPDLTAPGVGIVAARAAGTSMGTVVDDFYTSANGTSMATPHVAGAAALLKERYPDWTGEQLKAALVSHTEQAAGLTPYEQGSGRTAVDASLDSAVDITGTVDFGTVLYSASGDDVQPRTLTLSNRSDKATKVALRPEVTGASGGKPLAEGALRLSATEVTVPAHGSADVTVALNPAGATPDTYTGRVLATVGTTTVAHTAVGFTRDVERFALGVALKDRHGDIPFAATTIVMGLDNDFFELRNSEGSNREEFQVPAGSYGVLGGVVTGWNGSNLWPTQEAGDLFNLSDVEVAGRATTVTADAELAKDFAVRTTDEKRPLEPSSFSYETTRADARNKGATVGVSGDMTSSNQRYGAIPSKRPAVGTSAVSFFRRDRAPLYTAAVGGKDGFPLGVQYPADTSDQRYAGAVSAAVVDAGTASAADLARVDVKGKAALYHDTDPNSLQSGLVALQDAGAALVVVLPADEGAHSLTAYGVTVPYFAADYRAAVALAKRVAKGTATTLDLRAAKESAYTYSGQWIFDKGIPSDLSVVARKRDFAKARNTIHADGKQVLGHHMLDSWNRWFPTSTRFAERVRRGVERDEYLYARDSSVTYGQTFTPGELMSVAMVGPARSYRPGKTTSENWFAPAMAPGRHGMFSLCTFCRAGDELAPIPSFGGDSDPDHWLTGVSNGWGLYAYRDGEPIEVGNGDWGLDRPADYRFVLETSWDDSWPVRIEHGTSSRTDYRFTSARPTAGQAECGAAVTVDCAALPTLTPSYDMPVDLLNRARAGHASGFTLDAVRAEGWPGSTAVSGAKVSVSYDGGTTWTAAKVKRSDRDSFTVSYRHPALAATDGYVAVKSEIWDAHGTRTIQEIGKAYALR